MKKFFLAVSLLIGAATWYLSGFDQPQREGTIDVPSLPARW